MSRPGATADHPSKSEDDGSLGLPRAALTSAMELESKPDDHTAQQQDRGRDPCMETTGGPEPLDICRDLRKVTEPKLTSSSDFSIWKRMITITLEGISPGLSSYLLSPSIEKAKLTGGKSQELMRTIEKHSLIMKALRATMLRLLPLSMQGQLLMLKGWSRAEALKNVTFTDYASPDVLGQAGVPEQLDELAHVATMFSHLRTQYEPTTQSEKQAVWGKLEQLQMKGNDFETLYTQLTMIAAELQSVGQAVTQEKLYAVLIKALPRSALPVIATIQAEEKTFDQAVKILRTYFRTQQSWTLGRATSRGAGGESTDDMEILDIKQQGWRQGQGKDRPICEHCRKPGHTMDTCWRLHPELKKGRPARPSAVQVAYSGMCLFCGHLGHTQAQCKLKQVIELRKGKNGLITKITNTSQEESAQLPQEKDANEDDDASTAVAQVLVARLERIPSSIKVQLDSAADVHLSGVASLFTHKTTLT